MQSVHTRDKIHQFLQAFGLFGFAVGVPLSKVVMSIATIWLTLNFLIRADFKGYWQNWKKNLVFWFIISLVLLHGLGLLYTTDFKYALNDINAKLPLFLVPIISIGYPVPARYFNWILLGFIVSILITSGINFNAILQNPNGDYRDYSLFGSHIRYALIVVSGILVSIYFIIQQKSYGWVFLFIGGWLIYYTIISRTLSGYLALLFLGFGVYLYFISKIKKQPLRRGLYAAFAGITMIFFGWGYLFFKPNVPQDLFGNLPEYSQHGERYYHDTLELTFENGVHILSCIAWDELEEEWEKRSTLGFEEKFESGYSTFHFLVRYMASKNLTKDKEGMLKMTEEDIRNVEQGVPTILYSYNPIKRNVLGLKNEIFQYMAGGNPNGSSLAQRFEHWRAGKKIIQKNGLIGVGTGDVQVAFNDQYEMMNSRLDSDHRNRAHNQFMTFWITFGVFGFLIFTGFWIVYLKNTFSNKNILGLGFTLIVISSFLFEDTIETQQGVCFVALFLALSELWSGFTQSTRKERKAL